MTGTAPGRPRSPYTVWGFGSEAGCDSDLEFRFRCRAFRVPRSQSRSGERLGPSGMDRGIRLGGRESGSHVTFEGVIRIFVVIRRESGMGGAGARAGSGLTSLYAVNPEWVVFFAAFSGFASLEGRFRPAPEGECSVNATRRGGGGTDCSAHATLRGGGRRCIVA